MLKTVVLLNIFVESDKIFTGLFDEYKVQMNNLFETEIFCNNVHVFTVISD